MCGRELGATPRCRILKGMEASACYQRMGAFPSSFHPFILPFLDPLKVSSRCSHASSLASGKSQPNWGGLDEVGRREAAGLVGVGGEGKERTATVAVAWNAQDAERCCCWEWTVSVEAGDTSAREVWEQLPSSAHGLHNTFWGGVK